MNMALQPLATELQRQESELIAELEAALRVECSLILIESLPLTGYTSFRSAALYARGLYFIYRDIRRIHNLIRLSQSRQWVFGAITWWGDDEPPPVSWCKPQLPPPPNGRPSIPRLPDGLSTYEAVRFKIRLLQSELEKLETEFADSLLP